MIICPNCRNQEMEGALFCSNCGAQLVASEDERRSATVFYPHQRENKESPEAKDQAGILEKTAGSRLSLLVIDFGDMISANDQNEITIGRVSDGQPIIPDIDLSAYQAYEAGVSRLHASIGIRDTVIHIVDLGSANGTRVNGRKVNPHTPFPLKDGDVITLGKLKLQVLLQN